MGETIGYEGITTETVDTESQYEREIKELISKSQEELGALENNSIKNLTDKQLAAYMTKQFLEGGVQRYSHYVNSNNLNTLEFCLRAALQLLGKGSDEKYDAKGGKAPEDPNAKTIDERLMASNGITIDGKVDDTIVRILQRVVGAEVDGKPGPQTIVKTVLKLGGNVSKYYEKVNTLYKGNSKYEIHDVKTFNNSDNLLDGPYSYDSSKIESIYSDSGVVKLKPVGVDNPVQVTIDPVNKTPSLEGYVFKDGWVSKKGDNPNPPANLPPDTEFQVDEKEFQGTIEKPYELYQVIKAGMETEDLSIPNLSPDDTVSDKISITPGAGNSGGHAYSDYSQIVFKSGNYAYTNSYSIKDFLNGDGNFNKSKWQNMLPEIKSELRKKALAIRFANNLRDNKSYDINLFDRGSDNISDYNRSKLNRYFGLFANRMVKVDNRRKYTHASGDSIMFDLDNVGLDKGYNRNLLVDPLKIEDGSGNFVEDKFKSELKNIILNVILPQFS